MTAKRRVWPGKPYPMGAQFDGHGGSWQELLTDRPVSGGVVAVAELWRELPIALLVRA